MLRELNVARCGHDVIWWDFSNFVFENVVNCSIRCWRPWNNNKWGLQAVICDLSSIHCTGSLTEAWKWYLIYILSVICILCINRVAGKCHLFYCIFWGGSWKNRLKKKGIHRCYWDAIEIGMQRIVVSGQIKVLKHWELIRQINNKRQKWQVQVWWCWLYQVTDRRVKTLPDSCCFSVELQKGEAFHLFSRSPPSAQFPYVLHHARLLELCMLWMLASSMGVKDR